MSVANLKINKTSTWDDQQIQEWLNSSEIPMRLACVDKTGFPVVCSLWFVFYEGSLWCATHESSKIIEHLKENNKCAFEIAVNDIPYKGVRGQGFATLVKEKGGEVLPVLIQRYLGNTDSILAKWLLSRCEDEYAIKIDIDNMTSWDFSNRMS